MSAEDVRQVSKKFSARYGDMHIIVCDYHRQTKAPYLRNIKPSTKDEFACYFCARIATG
jgi:hypothetical protein